MATSAGQRKLKVRPLPRGGRLSAKVEPYLLVLPALVVCIGILYPFFLSVWYSFTNYTLTYPVIKFTGIANYKFLASNAGLLHATGVTFSFATLAVSVELTLGLALGLLLNRETPFAKIMRAFVIVPLMMAPVLGTLIWKLMMNPSFGVANWLLSPFGLRNLSWGDSYAGAMPTAALIDIWIYTPFVALLVLAGLRSINAALYEAASIDGLSTWTTFRSITLPAIAPYLIVVLLFRLVDSLNAFDILFALTKGGPGNALWNYQISAYYQTITYSSVGVGSAFMFINWIIVYALSQALVTWWNRTKEVAA